MRTPFGITPLMFAAAFGMVGVMRALVVKGAEVDALDEDGETALLYAVRKKQEDEALYLLEEAGAAWEVEGQRTQCLAVAAFSV